MSRVRTLLAILGALAGEVAGQGGEPRGVPRFPEVPAPSLIPRAERAEADPDGDLEPPVALPAAFEPPSEIDETDRYLAAKKANDVLERNTPRGEGETWLLIGTIASGLSLGLVVWIVARLRAARPPRGTGGGGAAGSRRA